MKPCQCEQPGFCPTANRVMHKRLHQLCQYRPDYRKQFWSNTNNPNPYNDCEHLREPTGDFVDCQTCQGSVKLKVFGCDIHGYCIKNKQVDGMISCETCGDYQSKG